MHGPSRRRILPALLLLIASLAPSAAPATPATPDPGLRTLAVAIGGRREQLAVDTPAGLSMAVAFEPGTIRMSGDGQRAVRRLSAERADLFSAPASLLVAVRVPVGRPDAIPLAVQRAQVIRDRLVLTLKVAREDAVMAAALVDTGGTGSADAPEVLFAPIMPAGTGGAAADAARRMRTLALDSMFAAQAIAQWEEAPAATTTGRDTAAPAATAGIAPLPRPAVPSVDGQGAVPLERFGPAVMPPQKAAPRARQPAAPARPVATPAAPPPAAVVPPVVAPSPVVPAGERPSEVVPVPSAPAPPAVPPVRQRPPAAVPEAGIASASGTPACPRPQRVIDDFYPGGPIVPCPVR